MSDTPMSYYSDPRRKALQDFNAEVFRLEEKATALGLPDVRGELFNVRWKSLTEADMALRNEHKRLAAVGQEGGGPNG